MAAFSKLLVLLFGVWLSSRLAACDSKQNTSSDETEASYVQVDESTIRGGDPMTVIEPLWWQVNIYDGPEAYEASLTKFSKPQRLVLGIIWYEAEVNNGGHDQFYSNSTGIVWRDAVNGFEAIGANKAAAILRESIKRLGGNPSLDRAERQKQMESLAPQFEDIDTKYYELQRTDLTSARLMVYIREHAKDFLFSGIVNKPVLKGSKSH